MKKSLATVVCLVAAFAVVSCNKLIPGAGSGTPKIETDEQKTLYTLGTLIGGNVTNLHLTPAELEIVHAGFVDAANGKEPQFPIDQYGPKVNEFARSRVMAAGKVEADKAGPFLDQAAKEPGAIRTPSGLVFRQVKAGTGASPAADSHVRVHYHGTLIDGTVFDSSVERKEPAEFALNEVIPCWTEALMRMKVGEKAHIVCPSAIGYGPQGRPPKIPGGAALVFDVELLEILK